MAQIAPLIATRAQICLEVAATLNQKFKIVVGWDEDEEKWVYLPVLPSTPEMDGFVEIYPRCAIPDARITMSVMVHALWRDSTFLDELSGLRGFFQKGLFFAIEIGAFDPEHPDGLSQGYWVSVKDDGDHRPISVVKLSAGEAPVCSPGDGFSGEAWRDLQIHMLPTCGSLIQALA